MAHGYSEQQRADKTGEKKTTNPKKKKKTPQWAFGDTPSQSVSVKTLNLIRSHTEHARTLKNHFYKILCLYVRP